MEIIIEELNNPSLGFLDYLYKKHLEGVTLKLPSVLACRIGHESFEACALGRDLQFYKWFSTTFKNHLDDNGSYSVLYENCLIEQIEFTEQVIAFGDYNRSIQVSRRDLVSMSLYSPLKEVPIQAISNYVEWLIGNGRLVSAANTLVVEFIERLVFKASICPRETVKSILLTMMIDGSREDHMDNLFVLMRDHDELPERCRLLVDLMGEIGLFSQDPLRRVLLLEKDPKMEYLTTKMRGYMFGEPVSSQLYGFAIDVFCLKSSYYLSDQELSDSAFTEVLRIDKETGGAITRLGPLLCRSLIGQHLDKPISHWRRQTILKMICEGHLLPPMSPTLICDMAILVAESGDIELITKFHSKMLPNSVYFLAVNDAIFNRLNDEDHDIETEPLAHLMTLLGKDLDLREFYEVVHRFSGKSAIFIAILESIMLKDRSQDLNDLADHCLAGLCDNLGSAGMRMLEKCSEFIGDETLAQLLGYYDCLTFRPYYPRIKAYALRHPKEYLGVLISKYFDVSLSRALLEMTEIPSVSCIRGYRHSLIIGSRVYSTTTHEFYILEVINHRRCKTCNRELLGAIFHDSSDSHGVYICEQCTTDTPTVSRVSCNVCLTDDASSRMKIISCGHTYCNHCLFMVVFRDHPACPMCRQHIENILRKVDGEDVEAFFWKEFTENSEETKKAARLLIQDHSNEAPSLSEGSDSNDDEVPMLEGEAAAAEEVNR